MFAAEGAGARVVKVPLTKTYAHDVRAMIAAAPDAGVFYVCTPNNPTGTLTSHTDIEYLLENKPKGSIVLVDEAYIHFCDAPSAIDLVKAGQDIIVLRTFSKLYGMAGLRCGFAIGRPDLHEEDRDLRWRQSHARDRRRCGIGEPQRCATRPRAQAHQRRNPRRDFPWLDRNGYSYIPSVSNCFMLDTKRPAKDVIDAMAQQNVHIGRIWPLMPTYARITVGTRAEMDQFQAAFQKVMKGTVVGRLRRKEEPLRHIDGFVLPASAAQVHT